jgi:RNA polymerase sigma-70 factor (ECF subfamily)
LVLRWYEHLVLYARRLFRPAEGVACADYSEDVVQEAFALVMEKASLFDPTRRLAPWLRSVVHNLALNLRRRESRYQGLGISGDTLPTREIPAFELAASRELLGRLSKEERDLFCAVFFQGAKVKDLACRRGEPPSKLYGTLHELKQRVQSALVS